MLHRVVGSSIALATMLVAHSAVADETVKIAVLPVQRDASARGLPSMLDEIVLTAAEKAGRFKVIGQSDIAALLNFEKQKDMLGCDELSCMAEIGGALGVDKLLSMSVSRISPNWVVTSKLINVRTSEVEERSVDYIAGDANQFLQSVPVVVAKLLGGKISEVAFGGGVQITVPRVNVNAGGGSGIGTINLEAERALEAAMEVEENPSATPEERERVWCKLAGIGGNNAYRDQARQGCESWRKYIQDMRQLRSALAKDYETLSGYLQLRRRTSEQKVAVVDSFLAAYGGVSDDARVAAVAAVRDDVAAGKEVSLVSDRDGDGISDGADKCPDQPGTEAARGCAPSDEDNDGFYDALDECPTQAEDVDGHRDDDGCPDNDNDGDGVPDAVDQCPTEKEDNQGDSRDPDGCPGTLAGVALMDGHPDGTWGLAIIGRGFGDDDFDTGLQWGVGLGLMGPQMSMAFVLRLGIEDRVWEPPDGEAQPLLMIDYMVDVQLLSFPRADDTFISPLNLMVGGMMSIGGAQDFSGDVHFSLTPSVANFVIIAKSFRLGARFAYPISLSGDYKEPPRVTFEVGLGNF